MVHAGSAIVSDHGSVQLSQHQHTYGTIAALPVKRTSAGERGALLAVGAFFVREAGIASILQTHHCERYEAEHWFRL